MNSDNNELITEQTIEQTVEVKRTMFSVDEDVRICNAWIHISQDRVTGKF